MNLTKKEAVRLHRLLWNKIADILERDWSNYDDGEVCNVDILKLKAIEELRTLDEYCGDDPFLRCFCCEYANKVIDGLKSCVKCCPIIWDEPGRTCRKSEFGHFVNHVALKEMREAKITAKIIANLPERPDQDFDIL